jgi:leucyl aminopeptidase
MKVAVVKKAAKTDGLILPGFDDLDLSKPIYGLPESHRKAILELVQMEDWKWKSNHVKSVFLMDAPQKVVLLGLGKREKFTADRYQKVFGRAVKELLAHKAKSAAVLLGALGEVNAATVRLLTETLVDGAYRFMKYKSDKKPAKLEEFQLVTATDPKKLSAGAEQGVKLAEALAFARDLTNEPANFLTPTQLAAEAVAAGKKHGFEVQVFDEKKIRQMKMEAFWQVARGSEEPPRLIVMRYLGNPKQPKEIVGLVGKGLTYDSGGYALKPAEGMAGMKNDMGGSAAVIGAICALASMKAVVNVTAVVAACENMLSGHAYRNGDVIGSMAGKTIEVNNTDAEGRLTLADAVYYAVTNEKVTKLADIATLTGAAVVALGPMRIGVVDNDEALYQTLADASGTSGERIWRLPNDDDYRDLLRSDIADLKNTGGRQAGTVVAGLFIRDFVEKTPWVHLDIASTAFNEKEGATGSGVRILTAFCEKLAK